MPSDNICQYHGVPCPEIQKSSIGPSLSSVMPKTTPRLVTKQSKLTTHSISFKTYPEELKTTQTPRTFSVTFDGKTNGLLIGALVLLVVFGTILTVLLIYLVIVKLQQGRKDRNRNDDELNPVELLPSDTTDTSEASRVTATTSGKTFHSHFFIKT